MNKRLNLMLAASAAMLLATSCGSEEDPIPATTPDTQRINIMVSDGRQSLSRAGRPLESSEALQAVENVKVIVTDAGGAVVWTRLLCDWNSSNTSKEVQSAECEGGRCATIEIPKEELRLETGVAYTVYAYGYSNYSDYDLSEVTAAMPGRNFNPDFTLTLNTGIGEEIFAGTSELVRQTDGATTNITLKRQVAGTFGYFHNIPYMVDPATRQPGRYLHLIASNPQRAMVMGMYDADYVAGGVRKAYSDIVYTIDLTEWFRDIEEGVNEHGTRTGTIAAGANWKGKGDRPELRYANGSVFAGAFILPFAKTEGTTFTLALSTDNGARNILRSWDVLLPAGGSNSQLSAYTLWSHEVDSWTSSRQTDTERCYSVLRNCLYGVGKHPFALLGNGGNPGTPGNPDDEDEPVSLNNKQELGIVINHNWNTIYQMEID